MFCVPMLLILAEVGMGKAGGNLVLPVLWAPRAGAHGPDSAMADQQTPLWKCEVLTTQWSLTSGNFPYPLVFCVVFLEWLMPVVLQCFSYGKEQIKNLSFEPDTCEPRSWERALGDCDTITFYVYLLSIMKGWLLALNLERAYCRA